jgi:hypothetical protein
MPESDEGLSLENWSLPSQPHRKKSSEPHHFKQRQLRQNQIDLFTNQIGLITIHTTKFNGYVTTASCWKFSTQNNEKFQA